MSKYKIIKKDCPIGREFPCQERARHCPFFENKTCIYNQIIEKGRSAVRKTEEELRRMYPQVDMGSDR